MIFPSILILYKNSRSIRLNYNVAFFKDAQINIQIIQVQEMNVRGEKEEIY